MQQIISHSLYRGLVATLVLFLSGCSIQGILNLRNGNANALHQWNSQEASITVPFYWHDGHMIIDLSVNGQKNLKFAFDSGAAATVLFESSRSLNTPLQIEQSINMQGSDVNVVNNATVKIKTLAISELTIVQVPITSSPLFSDINEAYFDGAIGYDLLNHYTTQIDYANQKITFFKNLSSDKIFTNSQKWHKLPITLNGRIPYIKANLSEQSTNSVNYQWVVDTGAPDFIYLNSQLAEGIIFPSKFIETQTTNFEGKQIIRSAYMDSFKLADFEFIDIASHNLPKFEDDYGVGLIGSGLLRNFDVIFDYKNNTMAIRANQQFSNKTYLNRSGINLEPHTKGAVVKSIASVSKAKILGLKLGDIVSQIDKQTITADNFDLLRAKLSSKQKSVNLCWTSKQTNQHSSAIRAKPQCEDIALLTLN